LAYPDRVTRPSFVLGQHARGATTLALSGVIPVTRNRSTAAGESRAGTLDPIMMPNGRGGTGTLTVGVRCPAGAACAANPKFALIVRKGVGIRKMPEGRANFGIRTQAAGAAARVERWAT